jgi:para-nitrobenzyl esterase
VSAVARETVVSVSQGRLGGRIEDGVAVFKGIRYAAPPIGANRFTRPQPAEAWDGVRDAREFGPIAAQPPYPPPFNQLLGDQGVAGPDCLTLNIWTPDQGARGLPVMVWIHGGSFLRGAGSLPAYDGRRFARDGIVCVSINYRLGAEGFLDLDGAVQNRGLLDQIAALEWVNRNIAAFGGDAQNVTVFGESAGAFSIGTLIATPSARGLFHRAILQSGAAHHTISKTTSAIVRQRLADTLGVRPELDAMASVPLPQFIDAQAQLAFELAVRPNRASFGEVAVNGMLFEPVVDGDVLPRPPKDAIAAGASMGLDVLIGTTTEEWRFFSVPTRAIDFVTDEQLPAWVTHRGLGTDAIAVYRTSRPGASPGDIQSALATDFTFHIPALRLAEAHSRNGGRPYVYEFSWRSPMFDGRLGACHALEIPFVFDNLETGGLHAMAGDNPPQALADAMHRSWVAFATDGSPGWHPYAEDHRAVMTFGQSGGSVVIDPAPAERELWDGVR